MYVFGGCDFDGILCDTNTPLFQVDINTLAWKTVATFSQIEPRYHHTACVHNDIMYLCGGRDEIQVFDQVYSIDLVTFELRYLISLPNARYGHVSFFEEHLYLFGGCDHEQDFNKNGIQTKHVQKKNLQIFSLKVVWYTSIYRRRTVYWQVNSGMTNH
jgi:hypothetical protein